MPKSGTFSHLAVIGSSAGGIDALSELVFALPEDFSALIIVAQHLDPERASHLEQILSHRCALPANRHVNITDLETDLSTDRSGELQDLTRVVEEDREHRADQRRIRDLFGGRAFDAVDDLRNAPGRDGAPQSEVTRGESFTLEFFAVAQEGRRHRRPGRRG